MKIELPLNSVYDIYKKIFPGDIICLCFVGAWLRLVEHRVRDAGVGGSNPLAPTNKIKGLRLFS